MKKLKYSDSTTLKILYMMNRFYLLIVLLFVVRQETIAQMKLGVSNVPLNNNAIFEMEASTKGMLLPRLSLTSVKSAAPLSTHVEGMLVYNTATAGTGATAVKPGIYINNGEEWVLLAGFFNYEGYYAINTTPQITGTAGITSYTEENGNILTSLPANALHALFTDPSNNAYTWNGVKFNKIQTQSNTAWNLSGTGNDAGRTKTAPIARTGKIAVGSNTVDEQFMLNSVAENNSFAGTGAMATGALKTNTFFSTVKNHTTPITGVAFYTNTPVTAGITQSAEVTGLLVTAYKQKLAGTTAMDDNSGTLQTLRALVIQVGQNNTALEQANGTITNSFGIYLQNRYSGSAATTYNAVYDFFSEDYPVSEASIVNRYGLYINGSSKLNYLAGKLAIGKTATGSTIAVSGLPVYSTNNDAVSGGLTAGDFYRDATGFVRVVF